ncbi:probable cyclic nucleotide-gated ion channel 5 isoform X1 [Zingiber officinale]|uniref:probable cyclic nucleotide-gated ion channel 5 isoform X1 n=1 Tax=Zingiber officinale TaxID=94328 RepID=UPI001C4C3DA8|nr:probable cyclic nucleotide-gated ion channel 5 isoform X1 [Zingiber officinale]XP_042396276.1 probable cyclic nucleotide-gated ion channel 5 isoform X1 [Zingiber officinale]
MFDCSYNQDKFIRLEDSSPRVSFASEPERMDKSGFHIQGLGHPSRIPSKSFRKGVIRGSEGLISIGRSLRSGVSRAVFSEDLKASEKKIFDPQDPFLLKMNGLLVASCILSVAVDALFFYLPVVDEESNCLGIDRELAATSTTLRTLVDVFYLVRIALQFRTSYIAPSSRVFGRGELVIDPAQIAMRYLSRYFIVDFVAVLPLPQIVVWSHLHGSKNYDVLDTKNSLLSIVMFQYIPRLVRSIPLTTELGRNGGIFAETAWAGAVYYLLWYMLASHVSHYFCFYEILHTFLSLDSLVIFQVVGAFWYLLAVNREDDCWQLACNMTTGCEVHYLYCGNENLDGYSNWQKSSKEVLERHCSASDDNTEFNYGIYTQCLTSGVVSSDYFFSKFCYCLWWGLQNLSTLGQGLVTSTYPGEIVFSIALSIFGLILCALLIGNMQTYLQSLTLRLEEMRVKRRDSEQWMHHRLLPQELQERVRRYDQYKWLETRGVDEECLVQILPKDLRRDIKRHLCFGLVRRVPLFANMDERLLDAICERLKTSLYTEHSYIIREGDPVDEMLFIIRGRMESVTTDGGRSGFFNRSILKESDFCGEELLTWALDPKSGASLPSSTRTVQALTEVEAFALIADELKYVASQFRRLHSRQVQHTFRFYSQQWRTWASCFIQVAWRRYSKRKAMELQRREELMGLEDDIAAPSIGATIYVSRFAKNALKGVYRQRSKSVRDLVVLPKPSEPDFGAEDGE